MIGALNYFSAYAQKRVLEQISAQRFAEMFAEMFVVNNILGLTLGKQVHEAQSDA